MGFKENPLESVSFSHLNKDDPRGNWSNLATSWSNWDNKELITLPKITQQYLKSWFAAISSTWLWNSFHRKRWNHATMASLILLPLILMSLSPLYLVFGLHTFMLKYYILALFLANVAWKDERLMNKWGFYKPYSLQRI